MVRILVVITTSFVPYGGLASVMMNFYRAIDKTRFHIDFASTNLELNPKLALELKQNGSKYYGLGNRKKFIINYAKIFFCSDTFSCGFCNRFQYHMFIPFLPICW